MQGILFIYPMFEAGRQLRKTQTRRFHNTPWKVGQLLYVKEPVILTGQVGVTPKPKDVIWQKGELKYTGVQYLWDNPELPKGDSVFWTMKQKLFCPEIAARYMVKIESVQRQRLGDMTEAEYQAEGLQRHFGLPIHQGATPQKEWRVEMANDRMFSDADPANVYRYLINATAGGKPVYGPDLTVWAYTYTWWN